SKTDWNVKFLTGLIFTLIAGVLLVAKHYGANHYLLPELLLTGITFYFILKILSDLKPLQKTKPFLLPAVVIIIGTTLLLNQPKTLSQTNKNYLLSTQEVDLTNLMVKTDYTDFGIINYYSFSLNKYTALKFGDIYAKGRIRPHLYEKYPNTFFYDYYNNKFQNWDTDVQLGDIVDLYHGKILLVNGPTDESTLKEMAARGFPLHQIYKGNVQNIFMLDTLRYNIYKANKTENFKIFDTFDAEKTNDNNTDFLSNSSKMIGSSVPQSNEEARSGKHSVKMDNEIQFAIEYRIDSLKTGDSFKVDIWRKPKDSEAFLVISSKEQEVFYNAQNSPIESTDGWELIRSEFVVTEEMSQQPLYIYLWNPNKETVYFDDLAIKIANNDLLK
ncbi:MAG: hypothetical protein JXR61_04955, partial [Prolixibacteraceae bacterium]|nr:hypothetical protein [Prolixibacteraceae bacterium]